VTGLYALAGGVKDLPRRAIEATVSPYPASFDGSTLRYQAALFALMSMSIVGGMVMSWMAREIWHGRRDAYPHEPLFAMRAMFFCTAFTAVLRSTPEAAMMITWRESVDVAATIMVVKRWCDAAAFFPAMTWMALLWIYYPSICMAMVRIARQDGGKFLAPYKARERVGKLVKVIVLVFAISTLIAVGKRW
jgi:hypothetical protein